MLGRVGVVVYRSSLAEKVAEKSFFGSLEIRGKKGR
jgi:hypothetical protein